MNFVIPMAGKGQRFMDAGYKKPKMLISVKGKTLLEWSVDSLPFQLCSNLIFIGLAEHQAEYKIAEFIENKFKNRHFDLTILFLEKVTQGQSETALKAEPYLDFERPLLIYNIDTAFKSSSILWNLQVDEIDGVLGAFSSNLPQYSYARVNQEGLIEEVAEKVVISENALTGLYHFKNPKHFIDSAKEAIQNNERVKNEFYIAPLYNKLISNGRKFILDKVDEFYILGTPEEVKDFEEL